MNAKYQDGRFYSAFITSDNNNGTYNVYFLGDGLTFDNVPHDCIKLPLIKGGKASSDVDSYVGRVFFDEGGKDFEPGEFEVVGVGNDNTYVCQRVGSNDVPEEFDMGYTIRRVNLYESE